MLVIIYQACLGANIGCPCPVFGGPPNLSICLHIPKPNQETEKGTVSLSPVLNLVKFCSKIYIYI